MNQMELKHTWSFDRNSRLIRFHLWAWDTTPSQLTFCALFWGYVFAVPNLFVRLVWTLLWPFRKGGYKGGQRLMRWSKRVESRRLERKMAALSAITLSGEDESDDSPNRIAMFFANPRVRTTAKWIAYAVMMVIGATVVFALGWLMTFVPAGVVFMAHWFVSTDAWAVTTSLIVLSASFFACIVGVVRFFDGGPGERWLDSRRERRRQGDPSLKDVLVGGAWAVKTNTCPRIEIRDEG